MKGEVGLVEEIEELVKVLRGSPNESIIQAVETLASACPVVVNYPEIFQDQGPIVKKVWMELSELNNCWQHTDIVNFNDLRVDNLSIFFHEQLLELAEPKIMNGNSSSSNFINGALEINFDAKKRAVSYLLSIIRKVENEIVIELDNKDPKYRRTACILAKKLIIESPNLLLGSVLANKLKKLDLDNDVFVTAIVGLT